jgi:CubicO group peptidase (beta-lactamase class C family)
MPTAYIYRDGKPVKYTSDPLGEGKMKFRDGAKYSLPEGGLYSTATDLLTLYKTILNGGKYGNFRLLSAEGLRLMRQPHTGELKTGTPGAGWGLGWFVMKQDTAGQPTPAGTFGHGGRYGTYCFLDPKNDLIGIFLIHREGGSDERQAFVNMTYAALRP